MYDISEREKYFSLLAEFADMWTQGARLSIGISRIFQYKMFLNYKISMVAKLSIIGYQDQKGQIGTNQRNITNTM